MNFPPGLQLWSYFRARESRLEREVCRSTGLGPVTFPVCGGIGFGGPDGTAVWLRWEASGLLCHSPDTVIY